MDLVPRENCLTGQRRGPAAHGGDMFSSPDNKFLHKSTTPTTWRREWTSTGRCRSARYGNHDLTDLWLAGVYGANARRELPTGAKRRGPSVPGDDKFPYRDHRSFFTSTAQQSGDEN